MHTYSPILKTLIHTIITFSFRNFISQKRISHSKTYRVIDTHYTHTHIHTEQRDLSYEFLYRASRVFDLKWKEKKKKTKMCSLPLICPVFRYSNNGAPSKFITSTFTKRLEIILLWLFLNNSELTYLNLLCDGFPNDIPVYKNQNFMTIWRRRVCDNDHDTTHTYTNAHVLTRQRRESFFIFGASAQCKSHVCTEIMKKYSHTHEWIRYWKY